MTRISALALFLIGSLSVSLGDEPSLRVEHPWIFAVPPGSKDTAAFMTLVNTGKKSLRVTGAKTVVAERIAPMITTKSDGRMGMEDVAFFEIPAGGKIALEPGGGHLMIFGLKALLKPGAKVILTLQVEPGGPLEIEIPALMAAPE
jgi:copper(I)-binding protein